MIHAYDEQYLYDAMRNLGEAFDFAWTVCRIELDTFLSMMISSGAALFEQGTPKYVSFHGSGRLRALFCSGLHKSVQTILKIVHTIFQAAAILLYKPFFRLRVKSALQYTCLLRKRSCTRRN